jgi:hypothetical protein
LDVNNLVVRRPLLKEQLEDAGRVAPACETERHLNLVESLQGTLFERRPPECPLTAWVGEGSMLSLFTPPSAETMYMFQECGSEQRADGHLARGAAHELRVPVPTPFQVVRVRA